MVDKSGILIIIFSLIAYASDCQEDFQENYIEMLRSTKVVAEDVYNWTGKTLPSYVFTNPYGESISTADWRGQPTLVYFLFDYCDPCIQDLSIINEVEQTHKTNLNSVKLFIGEEAWLKHLSPYHKSGIHTGVNAKDLSDELGIRMFPKILLLDSLGKIIHVLDRPYLDKCKSNQNCIESIQSLVNQMNYVLLKPVM